MFRHLLVPLDGSNAAEAVLPVVGEIARRAGAKVTLLHVLEQGAPREVHGERHLTRADEAEEYLAVAARRLPTIMVDQHVHDRTTRHLPQSLADHVEELDADLVVLLTHGSRRPRDFLFGNIAQQLTSRGRTPVLVLRPGPLAGKALPFERILVPLDDRPEHAVGLGPATDLARLAGASLTLLTVVPTAGDLTATQAIAGQLMPTSTRELLQLAEAARAESLRERVQTLRSEGTTASGYVLRGDPCERIVSFFQAEGIDTIALGTHGRTGTEAFWWGSLAQRLLRSVEASFLLTPVESVARGAGAGALDRTGLGKT